MLGTLEEQVITAAAADEFSTEFVTRMQKMHLEPYRYRENASVQTRATNPRSPYWQPVDEEC